MTRAEAAKPNLFIVGAPKCGTTAWVEYLRTHPDTFFPEIKEPHYFATDLPGMRWTDSLAKYESLFERAGNAKVIGEASVMYSYSKTAARNICAYNPEAKILLFLRAQEDCLPSLHHQYLYRFSEDVEDFEEVWRLSGRRPPNRIPPRCRDPKMLDYAAIGRFKEQVERFLAEFPAEQVRVIRFEDWTSDPRAIYLQILRFLGLDDDGRTDFPRINKAKHFGRAAWMGRLILHPPWIGRAAVGLLRKISGREALGIASKLSEMIAAKGYRTTISPEAREEIARYYFEDNRRLEELLANQPS